MALSVFMKVIVPSCVLLPLISAISNYKYWNIHARVIVYYLGLSGLFNIIASVTSRQGINNLPFLHLYTILEFLILFFFFYTLESQKNICRIIIGLMIGFPFLAFSYILINDSLYTFNQVPRFTSGILITLFLLRYLIKDLGTVESNFSMFLFISTTGLLIYYCTSSTLFGLSSILLHTPKHISTLIWTIHAGLILLNYLMISIAFFKLKK